MKIPCKIEFFEIFARLYIYYYTSWLSFLEAMIKMELLETLARYIYNIDDDKCFCTHGSRNGRARVTTEYRIKIS